MINIQVQNQANRPWLKPLARAGFAILFGIYGQFLPAILIWKAAGAPEQPGPLVEVALRISTILMECTVLFLIAFDRQPLSRYIHLRTPLKIILSGLVAALPLILANRMVSDQGIRIVGEYSYFARITGSVMGGVLFLVMQYIYYFLEVFVLVYAVDRLAAALRARWPLTRPVIVAAGALFLFLTWSLAHGFVVTDLMGFGIGLYLPLVFALLYELTGSLLAPMAAWFLFLAI